MLVKSKKQSDFLRDDIDCFRKEIAQMRDEEVNLQNSIVENFRREFTTFWEMAQKEMNENKNEEFSLNREVNKLTNEIKSTQIEIEQADQKLKTLEKELGIKNVNN